MNSLIETYKNIDLYGNDVFITMLKNKFKAVCYTAKSIPTQGSPCKPSSIVRNDLIVNKAIFHKNGEVTILTNNGNLKFF